MVELDGMESTQTVNQYTSLLRETIFPLSALVVSSFLLTILGTDLTYFFIIYGAATIFYLEFVRRLFQRERSATRSELVLFFGCGLGLRLMFLRLPPVLSTDVLQYAIYEQFLRDGAFPYTGFFLPYPPLFAYILKTFTVLSVSSDAFRVLMIGFDVLDGFLLMHALRVQGHTKAGAIAAMGYLLLPPAIIESGWNGHFDPMVNALALLVIILAARQKPGAAGVANGLAICLKLYPAIYLVAGVFLLRSVGVKIKFVLFTALTVMLTIMPLIYLAGYASFIDMIRDLGAIPIGTTQSTPNYIGSISQYLAYYSTRSVQDLQLLSLSVVLIAFTCVFVLKKPGRRNLVACLLSWWLATLTGLFTYLKLTYVSKAFPVLNYWFTFPTLDYVIGLVLAVAALLIVMNSRYICREHATNRLVFLVLSMGTAVIVLNLSVMQGWYVFWFTPLVFLLTPKRYLLPLLLISLTIYVSPFTSSDFRTLGFLGNTTYLLPSDFREFSIVNQLGPELTTPGVSVDLAQSHIYEFQGKAVMGTRATCFQTDPTFPSSFYSIGNEVDQERFPYLLVEGNTSLRGLRIEFRSASSVLGIWNVNSTVGIPDYVDTANVTGNRAFDNLRIVDLLSSASKVCLEKFEYVGRLQPSLVQDPSSLALQVVARYPTAVGGSSYGYAGLLISVSRLVQRSDILTVSLKTNRDPTFGHELLVEIGVTLRDNASTTRYVTLARDDYAINNRTWTHYSISISEFAGSHITGLIIKAVPLQPSHTDYEVWLGLVQFSTYQYYYALPVFALAVAIAIVAIFRGWPDVEEGDVT